MNVSASLRLISCAAACAALAACATSEPPAPTVSRTRAPQNYQSTINNYFAFKLRGPQKNTRIGIGQPEPGGCSLDVHANSMRGWVVPVARETFSGEPTGKETVRVTARQYWFWFLGDTIAGITPREDQCPGIASAFPAETPAPTTEMPAAGQAAAAAAKSADPPAQRDRTQRRSKTPAKKSDSAKRANSKR